MVRPVPSRSVAEAGVEPDANAATAAEPAHPDEPPAPQPVIEELPRPSHVRSPSDVVRLIVSVVLMIVGYGVALGFRNGVSTFQGGVLDAVAAFPAGVRDTLVGITQLAVIVAPAAILVILLLRRQFKLALAIVAAAALGAAITRVAGVYALGDAHPPTWRLEAATESWLADTSFPPAEYLAAVAALATVAGAWASRRWRRAAAGTLVVLALARAATSGTLALDLLFAVFAGVAAGAAILLIFGGPDHSPNGRDVATCLDGVGLTVARVRELATGRTIGRSYEAETVDGQRLHVSVRDGDDRQLDLVYRLYVAARLRGVGEQHIFTTLRQDGEHKAFVALCARQVGAAVPAPVGLASVGTAGILFVDEWIDGERLDTLPLDQLTDDVLVAFWRTVRVLHDHRIAHRALRADVAMLDGDGRVWLLDFDNGEWDGPPPHIASDVAEALTSLALLVGPERAVASAHRALSDEQLTAALPYLQPLALSYEGQRRVRHHRDILQKLRDQVVAATGSSPVELARLERVSPQTLAAVLGAFVGMWVLLPKLANAGDAFRAVREASPGYLLAMVPITLLLYVWSTLEMMGACSQRLPFMATYRAQMAAAFMNRVTPSNVGGMGLNARYLQVSGVSLPAATATVGLTSATEAIVNVVLVVLFFTWAGRGAGQASRVLPSSRTVLVAVIVIAVALVVFVATPAGRRLLKTKVFPFLRGVGDSLSTVAHSPTRMLAMFGGGFGRALTDFAALAIALGAFGSHPGIAGLGVAYIGASVVASVSPTPGGIGAIEAALIAGLTGIGVDVAQATPAVLVYRLITYWLVMLPGWISLRVMRKRGEV